MFMKENVNHNERAQTREKMQSENIFFICILWTAVWEHMYVYRLQNLCLIVV
jgi:hypothetical protein